MLAVSWATLVGCIRGASRGRMIHWLGYAEIHFGENAHLALARAVEQSASDALDALAGAWFVDDRSITLSVEADTSRGEMMSAKRLLSALLEEADGGEAVIEVPPFERWSRSAGGVPSVGLVFGSPVPDAEADDEAAEGDRETIPSPTDIPES